MGDDEVRNAARAVLSENWQTAGAGGYTAPNRTRYPFQWLWDSCFTAIAWAALGDDDRARSDLAAVFANQTQSGFVPHIGYQRDPGFHASFWGRPGVSTLTQPPVYGHTIAELRRRGIDVPDEIEDRARRGLAWLFAHRRRPGKERESDGLVLVHPWESGCDDSPAFDRWAPRPWSRAGWLNRKLELVESLVVDREGAAVANPGFETTHTGFTALAAFAADELGMERPSFDLRPPEEPVVLTDLLGCLAGSPGTNGTADALAQALDPLAFGGPFGPASVRRGDPAFRPGWYWRGSVWPQITYLFWLAAKRADAEQAAVLAEQLQAGVVASGFAEHWHADSGRRAGSPRHSWSAIVTATL